MMSDDSNANQNWQELNADHHLQPFTNMKDIKEEGALIIESAKGVYLTDSDGNQMLDAMSGLWCVNMGYGNDELAEVAKQQMQQLPYYNAFFKTAHPPVAELSALLAQVAPKNLNHTFFTGSGSEANDTVIKLVRRYWAVQGKPEKNVIISRTNAYHGSTIGAGSLGGMAAMHDQGTVIPDVEHIDQPYWYLACVEAGEEVSPGEVGKRATQALIERIETIGVNRVAAFIAEPIQGAGGVIIPPDNYWPEIKRICKHYGILFIADEVICGFGRIGEWFGSDYYDLEPDLMPIAKGLSSGYLPIGGVMVSDHMVDMLVDKGGEFQHGYTYSGHPVCAAVAVANIKLMQRTNIVEIVKNKTAPYLQKRWAELADHPLVGQARGLGMLGALELVKDKNSFTRFDSKQEAGMTCRVHCFSEKLVMRAVGDIMIISPPLVMQEADIDALMERAWKALDLTQKSLAA